ncbi:MAG: hypothetical protein ACOYM3_19120 [Terrimicrobiaceae bacterium]
MKNPTSEASPAKTLLEEIKNFREAGHGTLDAVRAHFDSRLDGITSLLENLGAVDEIPPRKLRDIRDMLTILSDPRMKPPKGRLKDLKKMESIPDDLEMMVERWT